MRLFVAQGLDWIQVGRFERRIKAEEDADDGGKAEGQQDRLRGDHDGPAVLKLHKLCAADAHSDAKQAADERQKDRFQQELREEYRVV